MYDIWFISYNEPNAEENWHRVKTLVPGARRLAGIKGLANAYRAAAESSKTDWFWIIDGDNWLLNPSIFNFRCPDSADNGHLFVWPARNSINGLEYGNGAVKLYNRESALIVPDHVEDFSIAVCETRIKFPGIASETRINTSPLQAWTSGFREGFKLHRRIKNGEANAIKQYNVWTTCGSEAINGKYAIEGVKFGYVRFGIEPDFPINNQAVLEEIFYDWEKQLKKYDIYHLSPSFTLEEKPSNDGSGSG